MKSNVAVVTLNKGEKVSVRLQGTWKERKVVIVLMVKGQKTDGFIIKLFIHYSIRKYLLLVKNKGKTETIQKERKETILEKVVELFTYITQITHIWRRSFIAARHFSDHLLKKKKREMFTKTLNI